MKTIIQIILAPLALVALGLVAWTIFVLIGKLTALIYYPYKEQTLINDASLGAHALLVFILLFVAYKFVGWIWDR